MRARYGPILVTAVISWIPAAGQWTKPLYMLLKKDREYDKTMYNMNRKQDNGKTKNNRKQDNGKR